MRERLKENVRGRKCKKGERKREGEKVKVKEIQRKRRQLVEQKGLSTILYMRDFLAVMRHQRKYTEKKRDRSTGAGQD